METKDWKEKEREEVGKILDEIIADEENSEHNVSYYREQYLNRILSRMESMRTELVETAERLKFRPSAHPAEQQRRDIHNAALDLVIKSLTSSISGR